MAAIETIENVPLTEVNMTEPSPKKTKLEEATESTKKMTSDGDTTKNPVHGRPVLRFAKMSENATAPTYGSSNAAGADLYSASGCVIPAKGKFLVPTHIQIAVPEGCYGRVAPRSGLAAKHFIDVGAGVIDADYRGEVKVLLFNFGEEDFKVNKGDRVAQLVCERYERCHLVEEKNLEETDRGAGGFGSTGK